MDRRRNAWQGMIGGWALGAWEAGIALSNAQHVGDAWLYPTVALFAMGFYGWGGWLLGTLSPVRLPWRILVAAGAILLLVLNYRILGTPILGNWPWPLGGALAALLLYRWMSSRPRPTGRGLALGALLLFLPSSAVYGQYYLGGSGGIHESDGPVGPPPELPNVVLITWDTVRADTLPLYGGGGFDMPNLGHLAADGALFENFLSAASITGPAHASILSGRYPPSHGLRANGEKLDGNGLPLMSSILKEAGYATGGFVSGLPVRATFGFDTGFQHFDDRTVASPAGRFLQFTRFSSILLRRFLPVDRANLVAVPGSTVVERALRWYREQDRPSFLWVHLFDAHGPYNPEGEFLATAMAGKEEGPHAVMADCESGLLLQRGEIALLDSLLKDLLDGLDQRDPGLANTLVVLAADHGECFGEGGIRLAHEQSLYYATQHVPALVRLPGKAANAVRGLRSAAPASQVDLLPTVCEALGLPPPDDIQGRSLLPELIGQGVAGAEVASVGGDPPPPRAGVRGRYMEAYQTRLGNRRLSAWERDGWKLTWTVTGEVHSLHHFSQGDALDFADSRPEIVRELLQEGQAFLRALPLREAAPIELSAEHERELAELGYADIPEDEE